jgi:hypothetical protein
MKVRLRDIKVATLSSCTIILMTEFVRVVRACEGVNLQMQQLDVLRRVFVYGARADNPDLIVLFMRLKLQMIKHLHDSSLEKRLVNLKH